MESNIAKALQFVEPVFKRMLIREMKLSLRAWVALLVLSFFVAPLAHARKYASIVVDVETGAIHHEANPDTITYPASLTKMMLLYLTFKALKEKSISLHQKIPVSKHAARQVPTKLWLKAGSVITVQQAIYGVITKSANDAAVALAEALGKTESQFANKMTAEARRLGMSKTVFKNASGLPNNKQVTTARDMAILSISLYRDFPEYFAYFKKQHFTYKGKKYRNHNRLLGKVKGVDGIKTGFINASGFNLAASVVRDNKRIVAVVLGGRTSRSRDKHMIELLEGTYKKLKNLGNKAYMSMSQLIHGVSPKHGRIHFHPKASKIPTPATKPKSKGVVTRKVLSRQPNSVMPTPPPAHVTLPQKAPLPYRPKLPSQKSVDSIEALIQSVSADASPSLPSAQMRSSL